MTSKVLCPVPAAALVHTHSRPHIQFCCVVFVVNTLLVQTCSCFLLSVPCSYLRTSPMYIVHVTCVLQSCIRTGS